MPGHGFVEPELPLLDELHGCHGRQGLGHGGDALPFRRHPDEFGVVPHGAYASLGRSGTYPTIRHGGCAPTTGKSDCISMDSGKPLHPRPPLAVPLYRLQKLPKSANL
jgi:hypothetical protein